MNFLKILSKIVRNENNVEILSNIVSSEDLKISNKVLTARQISTSAHKNTKKSIIIRIRKIFKASSDIRLILKKQNLMPQPS